MELNETVLKYIEENAEAARELLLTLAPIPAPSNHEELRADFCKKWLEEQGAENVYIDEALNVVYPVGDDGKCPLKVFMAHSDVVFPDTEPLPLLCRDGKIYCPGVGDDTAHAVMLMTVAKFIAETKPKTDNGILLVINSCEEGLGNLKGCRKIMERYGDRITEFVSFDSHPRNIVNRAVGSHRYKIEIKTEGGHSYGNFGRTNAIAVMALLINKLYSVKLPENGKTTYNVGTVSGGTSVNTIAQNAEMLYEYRSDNIENLEYMQNYFKGIIDSFKDENAEITVTKVGDRPCGTEVDADSQNALTLKAVKAIEAAYGFTPKQGSGSTDCNVPLSMGIPSVCVGCVRGGSAHTREEFILEDSLMPGLKVAFGMILEALGDNYER